MGSRRVRPMQRLACPVFTGSMLGVSYERRALQWKVVLVVARSACLTLCRQSANIVKADATSCCRWRKWPDDAKAKDLGQNEVGQEKGAKTGQEGQHGPKEEKMEYGGRGESRGLSQLLEKREATLDEKSEQREKLHI